MKDSKIVEKLLDFYVEIRPHINGHNTAMSKFMEAITELRSSVPQDDFIMGLLAGEIIWRSKLSKYTEHRLIEQVCSEEEKIQYNTFNDVWSKKVNENRHLSHYANSAPDEWKTYRDFARKLHLNYFPHEVEYRSSIPYTINNVESFYKGIESYLWNTDECGYVFKQEDIIFKDYRKMGTSLTIIFKQDYLDPKYNLNDTSISNNS